MRADVVLRRDAVRDYRLRSVFAARCPGRKGLDFDQGYHDPVPGSGAVRGLHIFGQGADYVRSDSGPAAVPERSRLESGSVRQRPEHDNRLVWVWLDLAYHGTEHVWCECPPVDG